MRCWNIYSELILSEIIESQPNGVLVRRFLVLACELRIFVWFVFWLFWPLAFWIADKIAGELLWNQNKRGNKSSKRERNCGFASLMCGIVIWQVFVRVDTHFPDDERNIFGFFDWGMDLGVITGWYFVLSISGIFFSIPVKVNQHSNPTTISKRFITNRTNLKPKRTILYIQNAPQDFLFSLVKLSFHREKSTACWFYTQQRNPTRFSYQAKKKKREANKISHSEEWSTSEAFRVRNCFDLSKEKKKGINYLPAIIGSLSRRDTHQWTTILYA